MDSDFAISIAEAIDPYLQSHAALTDALVWASGSGDFQTGGKARRGWLKVRPTLEAALALILKEDSDATTN